MEAYKCVKCGVVSPLVDSNGTSIPIDKPCFKCGSTEKVKVILPNFSLTKKGKRRRFNKGGGPILRIGI